MKRNLKLIAICLIIVLPALWYAYEYPIALMPYKGDRVDLNFSKGSWVDCLANPDHQGFEILSVGISSMQIKDIDGTFSSENLPYIKARSAGRCDGTQIRLIDENNRIYEVPFRDLYTVIKNRKHVWSNPYRTS